MNHEYHAPKMAAARTRIPTPAPIPAFAPVERPEEPLPPSLEATSVGATPGVEVKVAGAMTVVAGWVVITIEVIVFCAHGISTIHNSMIGQQHAGIRRLHQQGREFGDGFETRAIHTVKPTAPLSEVVGKVSVTDVDEVS